MYHFTCTTIGKTSGHIFFQSLSFDLFTSPKVLKKYQTFLEKILPSINFPIKVTMNGQSVFDRSKWWSFCDEAASEATIIAEIFIPQNVTSLPFVSSIDLKKIIENKPIKTILKVIRKLTN